jgi:hypothetical protein
LLPTEQIIYYVPSPDIYYIAIYKYSATQNHQMEIYSSHSLNPAIASSSLTSPADAASAFAVAAIDYMNWITGPQEPFSSQGPANDGRTKPEISGPDGVSTYSYGANNFFGTSAASPHVAGAAALLLSKNPSYSVAQLWSALTSSAIDMGSAGQDNIYGFGRLSLPAEITPPVPGTVTPYNTQYITFVDSPFDLTTNFVDNESVVTSCEYTINASTWFPAMVSGSSPNFTCTKLGITGTNGQVLTLNMRATSNGGTGTATAVTRIVDSAPPTTSNNSTSTWTSTTLVTVTLSPSDGSGSGVALTKYCVDTTNSCMPGITGTSVDVSCTTGSECVQYVRYFSTDNIGNQETTKSSNQIRQDLKSPTDGILTAMGGNAKVSLNWTGFADNGSGLRNTSTYKVTRNTGIYPNSQCTNGTQVYIGSGNSKIDTGLVNGTTYYYRACAYDNAGNVSAGAIAQATPTVVTMLSPNGAEVIPSGSTYTIQWGTPAEAVKFDLEYSLDNGVNWKPVKGLAGIADDVLGTSFDWAVPKPWGNQKKCLVKVKGYNASGNKVGADKSDTTFTIEVVKLTSPNGGVSYTSGNPLTITWTTNATKRDITKVILSYTKDGKQTWEKIKTFKGSNPGLHDWFAPLVGKPKTQCKVMVELFDVNGNSLGKDSSDSWFTIIPTP